LGESEIAIIERQPTSAATAALEANSAVDWSGSLRHIIDAETCIILDFGLSSNEDEEDDDVESSTLGGSHHNMQPVVIQSATTIDERHRRSVQQHRYADDTNRSNGIDLRLKLTKRKFDDEQEQIFAGKCLVFSTTQSHQHHNLLLLL
jgi:hypothetical protein